MIKVIIIPDTQINLDTGVMAGLITGINPTIITIRIIITTARNTQIIHSLVMAAINQAARLIALRITTTTIKIGAVGKTATTNRNLGHLLWADIIKVGKIPLQIGMDRPAASRITGIALAINTTEEAGKARIASSQHRRTIMADIPIRGA
ncbi:hypothetical protein [Methyloglobulus morosus]|uniref:hypothetical protein n=1 Tax=Methyloglobulus morosus TaxID=1410681 RepID=UPI00128EDE57|nr:hypothetical protein [Methyloglobulus morosus]